MRNMLNTFFHCVVDNVQNNVPKSVMLFLITESIGQITTIVDKISKMNVDELLAESNETSRKRKEYEEKIEQLRNAKEIIAHLDENPKFYIRHL